MLFVWEQRKLGDLVTFSKGKGYTKKDIVKKGMPIFLYGNLYTHYSEKYSKIVSNALLKPNSIISSGDEIVLPDSGENPTDIARAAWISKAGVILGGGLIILHPANNISSAFLAYSLTYGINHKVISSRAQGKSIVHIHSSDLKNLNFIYPSGKHNQIKIFKLLDKMNIIYSLQQRKLKQLKQVKIGFSQFFFNSEILTKVPQFKLSNIGKTYSGLTGKTKKDFGHGSAKYITYLNVNQNEIADPCQVDSIEIDKEQNLVQKGDILFTISSETPEEVGLTSVWPVTCKDLYLNSFCFGFRVNYPERIDPFYLGYLFRSSYFRNKIFPLAQGISRFNLSKKNALKITIGVNSKQIQTQVTNTMKNINSMIKKQEQEIDYLRRIKQFLLQNMFI